MSKPRKAKKVWLYPVLILTAWLLTACQLTQSGFARTAQKDAATFSAAAMMLDYVHQQKLSQAYAAASFESFQAGVQDLETDLPSQDAAPPSNKLKQLLEIARPALVAVRQPCLEESCDWRSQLDQLQKAAKTLEEAGK